MSNLDQKQNPQDLTLNHVNQEDGGAADDSATEASAGGQHNDWGHRQAGSAGNMQSGAQGGGEVDANIGGNIAGNIGGNPGSQHNDWGHSVVPTDGNRQSAGDAGNAQSGKQRGLPRQGVMPGEEMGHLQRGQGSGQDGSKR